MGNDSQRSSGSSIPDKGKFTRRTVLTSAAASLGAVIATGDADAAQESMAAAEASGDERRLVSGLGQRSPHEKPRRLVGNVLPNSASKTPLQDLDGFITPSDLHYERHHSGVPSINPDEYTLRVEGLVERPTTFDLKARVN